LTSHSDVMAGVTASRLVSMTRRRGTLVASVGVAPPPLTMMQVLAPCQWRMRNEARGRPF